MTISSSLITYPWLNISKKGLKHEIEIINFLFSASILLVACGTSDSEADETDDIEQSGSEGTEIKENETDDVPEDFEGEYDLNITFIATPSADQYFEEEGYLALAELNQRHYYSSNFDYTFILPDRNDSFRVRYGKYLEKNDVPELIEHFKGYGFDMEFVDEIMQENIMPLRSDFIEMRYSDSLNTLEEMGEDLEITVSPVYRGHESYNVQFQSLPTVWDPGFAPSSKTENVPSSELGVSRVDASEYHPRMDLQRNDSLGLQGEHVIEVIDLSSDERFIEEGGLIYPEISDDEEGVFTGMILYENNDYQVVLFMTEADLAVGATTVTNGNTVLTPSEQEEHETLAESIREDLLNLFQREETQSIYVEHLGE